MYRKLLFRLFDGMIKLFLLVILNFWLFANDIMASEANSTTARDGGERVAGRNPKKQRISGVGGRKFTRQVLSVSWMPGYCETRPKAQECFHLAAERFEATHFTLHGLWTLGAKACPKAKNVAAAGRWVDLPEVALSPVLRAELAASMPGVVSGLDRHEWQENGRCSGMDAETFFRHALELMEPLNQSPVRELFLDAVGAPLTEDRLNAALVKGFGKSAAGKAKLRCKLVEGRNVITGLTLGLGKAGIKGDDLADRLGRAAVTDIGCKTGIVVSVAPVK